MPLPKPAVQAAAPLATLNLTFRSYPCALPDAGLPRSEALTFRQERENGRAECVRITNWTVVG